MHSTKSRARFPPVGRAPPPSPDVRAGGQGEEVMSDPFAPRRYEPYLYHSDDSGWIAWSAGPDRDYDLTSENIGAIYDSSLDQWDNPALSALRYDATNGTISNGDLIRAWLR